MIDPLLDTHTLLWFLQDDPRLGKPARGLIEEQANHKLVSIVTCWEIAIKVGIGKVDLGAPTRPYLERMIEGNRFDLLPITFEHVTAVEGLPIVGADRAFDPCPVCRLW